MALLSVKIDADLAPILSSIEVPGIKESPLTMHCTVLYLGDNAVHIIPDVIEAVKEVTSSITDWFTASVSYVSYFPPSIGKPVPVVLPVESPGLHDFRDRILAILDKKKVPYDKTWKNFVPHITLSYSDTKPERRSITPIEFFIASVELWPADDGDEGKIVFPIIVVKKPITYTSSYAILGKSISTPDQGNILMSDASEKLKEFTAKMQLQKALTASVVSSMVKRARLAEAHTPVVAETDYTVVPSLGIRQGHVSTHEAPVVRSEVLATPSAESTVQKSHELSECGSCGYMYKSLHNGCNRCGVQIEEAKPYGAR